MAVDHRSQAAINLLSQMLLGLSMAAEIQGRVSEDETDFALGEVETDGTTVTTDLVMPSGDVFRVSIAWDGEQSP
jgi:hypothetical protein